MKKWGLLVAATLIVPLSGCELDLATRTDVDQLRREMQTLRIELETERQRGVAINGRMQTLEQRSGGNSEWAYLDPAGGEGYAIASTGIAPVLLSFQGSEPIGDGTKIRFQVGNMTSATFTGMKATIRYNTRPPVNGGGVEQWNERLRTVEIKLPDRIRPGAWTTVSASLPGLKPDQLGHLAVKPELDVVSLQQGP